MVQVNIRGVGVELTQAMTDRAQELMDKLFVRYPPISHEITVKTLPDGVELCGQYHDELSTKSAKTAHSDFYAGFGLLRDQLLRQIEREHKTRKGGGRHKERLPDLIDSDE